jgi:hypothetical protein
VDTKYKIEQVKRQFVLINLKNFFWFYLVFLFWQPTFEVQIRNMSEDTINELKNKLRQKQSEGEQYQAKAEASFQDAEKLKAVIAMLAGEPIEPPKGALFGGLTFKDAVFECIRSSNRILRAADIVSKLAPNYADKTEETLKANVSSILSNYKAENRVQSYGSKKNMVWGLPNMFEDNGMPKQGFL